MMHPERTFCIAQKESVEDLARDLYTSQWTLCTGFHCEDHLFLNDSFSEDGAQEYAVFRYAGDGDNGLWQQVESLTVSWMKSSDEVQVYLREALESSMRIGEPIKLRLEIPGVHRCYLCA